MHLLGECDQKRCYHIASCYVCLRRNTTDAESAPLFLRPGLTGVGLDEAVPLGLEVERVADYAILHLCCLALPTLRRPQSARRRSLARLAVNLAAARRARSPSPVRALSIEQWFGADLHASVYIAPHRELREHKLREAPPGWPFLSRTIQGNLNVRM